MSKSPKSAPPLLIIAGPCVIESEAGAMKIARHMDTLCRELDLPYVFKASFDKANRSSIKSFRGPGLKDGLKVLGNIKKAIKRPVLSDIHEPGQCKAAARVLDILQIPAFLCRQTDLLVAAAQTGRCVNVKKGQFLAPEDTGNIVKKLRESGCTDYYLTERGNSFGYHNLVVDMRGLAIMRQAGHRVIFDATHSVQRPGGLGDKTGGDSAMAPVLARAAAAVGVDGFFIETHPTPAKSKSDGPNMIALADMDRLLRKLKALHEEAHAD